MHYVRTSGGSMMPVNFKAGLIGSEKKKVSKVKINTPNKQKQRSVYGSK